MIINAAMSACLCTVCRFERFFLTCVESGFAYLFEPNEINNFNQQNQISKIPNDPKQVEEQKNPNILKSSWQAPLSSLSSGTRFGTQTQPDVNLIYALGLKLFVLDCRRKWILEYDYYRQKSGHGIGHFFNSQCTNKGEHNCRLIKIKLVFLALKQSFCDQSYGKCLCVFLTNFYLDPFQDPGNVPC